MKAFFLSIVLLISNLALSQIIATVINQETSEAVPFVNIWVEDENIGTTSNLNGKFVINASPSATLVFSAIGFETAYINISTIKEKVALKPVINQLDEIVLRPKIGDKELKIGSFKKRKINGYFVCGLKPWISARFFKYDSIIEQTIFLKELSILTKSDIKDSTFNLRLYGVGENGAPDGYIYEENIIVTAKKGKRVTTVDLSGFNIQFPKSGFFVAVEWLIVDENKYEYDYIVKESKEKVNDISYEPAIGVVTTEVNDISWKYSNGKWRKAIKNTYANSGDYMNKYILLAIELTLTN